MKKTLIRTALLGGAIAVAMVSTASALARSHHDSRVQQPRIKLSCQPGRVTIVNRGKNMIKILERSGRYFSLNANYMVPMSVSKLNLKRLSRRDIKRTHHQASKMMTVRTDSTSKFYCLVPNSCMMSVKNGQRSSTHYLDCKLPNQRWS